MPHRYWRLRGGANAVIHELEFRATAGGADQATVANAIGTSFFASAPEQAFDDDTGTDKYHENANAWAGQDFGTATTVAEVWYYIVANGHTFYIEYSDDGTNWTLDSTLGPITGNPAIGTHATNDSGGGTDALTADDIESAAEVSSPVIGQEHGLTAQGLESGSEVSSPTIGQTHALTASDVESAAELSAPTLTALSNVDTLSADSIAAASEVSAPELTVLAADPERQPGGFIPRPVIYLDEKGREVSPAKAVEQVVAKAIKEAPKPVKRKLRRVKGDVIAALRRDEFNAPKEAKRLIAHLERVEAEYAAIVRAQIERKQQDEEAAAILLLVA